MRVAAVAAGERLGRYQIVRHLATGGMAEIYLARAAGIGAFERYVVVKVIAAERRADQKFVRMFLDEARLAAALNHANVAQVYEVGEETGEYFYAMEYVHGDSARSLLEECARTGTAIPLEIALAVAIGAAAGLHHAHDRVGTDGRPLAIVHRDVSPSNLMVGYDGSVKVLDFGIARASERHAETESGVVKGKYAYMAPEQCRAQPLDRRADVFALGIVLYELATQVRAFKADSDFETMLKITGGELLAPSAVRPGFPPALEAIIVRALAIDPAARYQTARELGDALETFAERAGLSISQRAVERFMHAVYGVRPEPWRTTDPSQPALPALPLVAPPSRPSGSVPPVPSGSAPGVPATPQAETTMAPAIEIVSAPAPARSIARPLLVGLGLAAIGVVVAIAMSGGGSATRDAAPEPEPERSASAKATPGMETGSGSETNTDTGSGSPPPAPATITITLRSDPSGATVFLADERRGTTPLTLTVPASTTPLAIRLERAGSRPLALALPADRDVTRTVKLAPRRRTPRAGSADDETFTNPFAK